MDWNDDTWIRGKGFSVVTMKRLSVSGRRSDLEWTLGSPDIRVSQPSGRESRWQCGDRKKLRHLVSNFSKHSSMHGAHIICSNALRKSGSLHRLFYRVFIGGCLMMMLVSVIFLSLDSLGTESVYITSTSKDSDSGPNEDPYFPVYPEIMVCRRPAYRTDLNLSFQELVEYAHLSLGYPFSSLTPHERAQIIESAARRAHYIRHHPNTTGPDDPLTRKLANLRERYDELKRSTENFNVTNFIFEHSVSCEKVFVRCIAFVFHMNCCDIFRPILTSIGVCHAFSPKSGILQLESRSRSIGFALTFDLHSVPSPNKSLDVGYKVHISDPRQMVKEFTETEQAVINGFVTTMRTKLVKTQRTALYTPWHGLSTDCPRISETLDVHSLSDRYFLSYCYGLYLNMMMQKNCRCELPGHYGNLSLRQCDPIDLYGCFVFIALKDNLTDMSKVCREPCINYSYESESTYTQLGMSNISRLIFLYSGTQYVFNEYRTTTISSFLSQIGGAMGLYVGASIVTAWELGTFIVSWIWYRCKPTRRVVDAPEPNSDHSHHRQMKKSYHYH